MSKFSQIFNGVGRLLDSNEQVIDQRFFEKNLGKILVVIILLMSYIQLHYEYDEHLVNIGKLKTERNDMRYTSIEKWSVLTRHNRPETIRARVAQSSVRLEESDERPVVID